MRLGHPHRKENKKVKHSSCKNSKSLRVNQVKIQFTNKPITAWGGLATIVAKLLEVMEFRSWVESALPIFPATQREILQVKQWYTVSKGVEVGECIFQHYDPKWAKPRRYVVVRQSIAKRPKALGKQPRLFKDLIHWSQY